MSDARLPDDILRHLLRVTAEPDLSGAGYELVRPLGRGAMGAVWEVRDARLHRAVAMKVLHTGAGIAGEARIAASLEHPGIAPIHETGQLPDGRPYYTMRLVNGQRLDAYLTPATPLSERLRVFQKVCETVAFAHSRGVVHRDLKPSNIMAGPFGEVVILDWGLARQAGAAAEQPGTVAGTPPFMAPEVAAGKAHLAGAEADIYSLGALLAWLLPAGSPRALLSVAAEAMSFHTSRRYSDATALNAEIARYLDQRPVLAHRETLAERASRFASRNSTLLILLAAYVVVRFFLFFLPRP